MKLSEIHTRDPFILTYKNKYYMYGTRGSESYSETATGLDVFVSNDLKNWEGPVEVFRREKDFWATRDFWAPEVHIYNDRFYMFVSVKSDTKHRGTQIFVSDKPDGRFKPISEFPVTPEEWECLDGTLYVEDNVPYIIFCHEWTQTGDGGVYYARLSRDLKKMVSKPHLMWKASDYSDVIDISTDKSIESKVTDGPFMYKNSKNELMCIWSTMNKKGYCELVSKSDSGKIEGNWSVQQKPIFEKDGGHGMIFRNLDDELMFTMHCPNVPGKERVKFMLLEDRDGNLLLK